MARAGAGSLVHLWCGDEVGIVPLRRISVVLLTGQGGGAVVSVGVEWLAQVLPQLWW